MRMLTSHHRPNHNHGGSSSSLLFSSIFFLILLLLLGISLSISIGLGVFTLWLHPADPTMQRQLHPASLAQPPQQQQQQQLVEQLVPIYPNVAVSDAQKITFDSNNSITHTKRLLYYSNTSTVEQRRELEQMASFLEVPFYPPFTTIKDGEQLAQKFLSGQARPPLGGIIHVLQTFVYELRQSNKKNVNVSNDKTGEDIVRRAYFDLAQKYLVPLDTIYRNNPNIIPVNENDNTIFISLAAFREHLLYDTLKGAFGQAENPDKLYVGVVMQNCFGLDDVTGETYGCKTGAEVIGKDKNGHDMTRVSDKPPDINGVEQFCLDPSFQGYCQNNQLRILSIHETESLGPAAARYYASKLWYGEKYFIQVDSHLQFAKHWDTNYVNELQATSNYPKSVLSMYPPGFGESDNIENTTPGTRLCTCTFSESDVEDAIIRINNGVSYTYGVEYPKPTQIPFIAAGFFMARAEFLQDVPFDPFLPWCFMGEEIALSMRAWTHGWNIYAPRKNWIAHQYRPGRMGLPKFWGSVGRTFHRGIGFSNRLQDQVVNRIKHMVGYPETSIEFLQEKGIEHILIDLPHYGLGNVRSRDEYVKLTLIDFKNKKCPRIPWCNQGTLD